MKSQEESSKIRACGGIQKTPQSLRQLCATRCLTHLSRNREQDRRVTHCSCAKDKDSQTTTTAANHTNDTDRPDFTPISSYLRTWKRITQHPLAIQKIYAAHVMFYSANVMMVLLELRGLGLNRSEFFWGDLMPAAIISAFNFFSSILFITPGALGIREAMMAAIASSIQTDPNKLVVLSLYDRAVTLLFVFMTLPLFYFRKLLGKTRNEG